MTEKDERRELRFACECVSSCGGYSDPWSAIAQRRLLPDGTKEQIVNLLAREPKTIAQLAKELSLAQPSVYTHISDMLSSELLRESEEWEKKYPTERYYEPNFPVVKREARAAFDALCQGMAEQVAALFEKKCRQMESAFGETELAAHGWEFPDIAHYLSASVQRGAREMLEARGTLPRRRPHENGAEWVFWAEEPRE